MSSRLLRAVLLVALMSILMIAPGAWGQREYKTLYKFTQDKDGGTPLAGLTFAPTGELYGTTFTGGDAFGTVFRLTPQPDGRWMESTIYTFRQIGYNVGGLILDDARSLYGTTYEGGTYGGGVVFKLSPKLGGSWTESVLYNFCSLANCLDGGASRAGLIFDADGSLYGTTFEGGTNGWGVVFKLKHNKDGGWSETVLHRFTQDDGQWPAGALVLDRQGNLYGTTVNGGSGGCQFGCGVVFELIPSVNGDWKEKVLHRFTAGSDGSLPFSSLIFDKAGNLYGTTTAGGNSGCNGSGCGVAFRLAPNSDGSWKETILHRFTGGKDGAVPYAGLILDKTGNLYGSAMGGGDTSCHRRDYIPGCGVVFRLTPDSAGKWRETVLHEFRNHPGDDPWGGLIFDTMGNLYGTTFGDNSSTFGSVFEITP